MKVSAVVLTKDDGDKIKECLQTLNFCQEVIVVDDGSTDKTRTIAKKLGAKVYQRELKGDFAAQRNFGLEKAGERWILFVDADERVTPKLAEEIKRAVQENAVMGFSLKRDYFIWGKRLRYGETANVRLVRLARKGAGKWRRRVHEYWDIRGRVGQLKNPLSHYPHPTLGDFIRDVNFFSNLHAKEKFASGERSSLFKILVFPAGKFFKNWILLLGFLDGIQGFLIATTMSFHSFLAWGKLWFLQKGFEKI